MRNPTAGTEEKPAVKRSRKNAPKKAHTPTTVVRLQLAGQDYDCAAIVEAARAHYRATHKVGIHSCQVYIKPEEGMAYYVINRVEGKIPLTPAP